MSQICIIPCLHFSKWYYSLNIYIFILHPLLGFPDGSKGKESTCNTGDLGLIPGLGRSLGEGNGNPLQHSCLKNLYEQWSLVGYSPWGCKESDVTEWLSIAHYPLLDTPLIKIYFIHISYFFFPVRLLL